MAKRHKIWAKKKRRYMKGLLGDHCNQCEIHEGVPSPKTERPVTLVFDCIIPQGDKHHRGSTDQRISFYWKQFKVNNLQILCDDCHTAKSNKEHPNQDITKLNHFNDENEPF